MKPHYIFFLLCAVFITFLADGISMALAPIPGIGIVLALAITFCINATMGVGLLFALASFDMWHPRFGPISLIGGLIPGLNFLPFWVGLVVAGIFHDMNAEGKDLGAITNTALKLQSTYLAGGSPLQKMRGAAGIVMNSRQATGRPPAPQAANDNEPQTEEARQPRNLPMNDITPARTRTATQYAKAA